MPILDELNVMNMRFQLYSLACLLMTFFGPVNAQNACFETTGDTAGFSLSVETYATDVVGGLTTYRVYLTTPDTSDFLSAVIGDTETPLFVNSTSDFYQDNFGGTTPGSINPSLYEVPDFASVQYDSWVTIGIEQQPVLSAGQSDVSVLVDPNVQSWEVPFSSGDNIDISTPIGGGWYILPSSANGIAGAEKRVLVAQLTTDGDISGQMYMQIFPGGDQDALIENTFSFAQTTCVLVPGCMDATACNYNVAAEEDDQSCTYAAPNFDCNGDCLSAPTTFNVDMSCAGTAFGTVHVTGPWCGWCGAEDYNTLSDENEDGTYSVSVCIPAGDVEYKFMIDNWGGEENLADDMADGGSCAPVTDYSNYANRVTASGSTTSDTYGSCLTCDEQAALQTVTVSFAVDMSASDYPDASYDNVVINGSWNGWNGWGVTLTDEDQDGIYTGTLDLDVDFGEVQFVVAVTGPADSYSGWGQTIYGPEGGSCSTGSPANYVFTVGSEDLTFAVCAGLCDETCPTGTPGCMDQGATNYSAEATYDDATCLYSMSFSVDMSQSGVAGQVYLSGQFNGWSGTDNAMTDTDLDGVWDVTVNMLAGAQEYKFTVNDWAASESFDGSESCTTAPGEYVNRVVTVAGAAVLPAVCWSSCSACPASGCTTPTACNYTNLAGYDDGSCFFCCSALSSDMSGYALEQDIVAWDGIPGMRTYRFYITTPNADDIVSAVSGDSETPTLLSTTTSFYQDELGGAFPNGINPELYSSFPSLEFDSWVTIGIDQAPDLNANEAQVSFAESESWVSGFEQGQDLAINGFFGGAWFVTADNANGVAGEDKRVLIAQLTTDGELSGQFHVQVLPNGSTSSNLGDLVTLSFGPNVDAEAPSFVDFPSDVTIGCDDALPSADVQATDACSSASVSMTEVSSGDGCVTTVVRSYTATDIAGNSVSADWTISIADNAAPTFDSPADITVNCGDDLSPTVTGEPNNIADCNTFTSAHNDVQVASTGSCVSEQIERTWSVTDACGNEATAIQLITVMDAAAPIITEVPADTTMACDAVVPASNISATDDCGSVSISQSDQTEEGACSGASVILRTFVAVDPCGNSVQYVQTINLIDTVAPTFTSVPSDVTVGVYDALPTDAALATDNCGTLSISSNDDVDDTANDFALVVRTFTATDACGNTATAAQTITVLELLGCMDSSGCNYNAAATAEDGTCTYPAYGYECDGSCISDADFDGICDLNEVQGCNLPNACNYNILATENDGSCTYDCFGCTDVAASNYDSDALLDDGQCLYGGCTDATASNYSGTADFNDGSCIYLGCTNPIACNYTTGANQDDGSCDLTSCGGCTNDIACNYEPAALLNDGSCEFFSCRGCTSAGAFNYDITASEDDGSCIFGGCNNETAANYDSSADFNDGSCEFGGCTDSGACNFDTQANVNDGSCEYTSCAGCMITFACNYNPEATLQDDSQCDFYACCGDPAADNYEVGVADFLTYGCSYGGSAPMVQLAGCELTFACNYGDTENDCEYSSCSGCTAAGACNYDANATIPVTCLYPEDIYGTSNVDCAGNCINDANSNNVCDEQEESGCTNPAACNYADTATLDDGSCDTTTCAGCTDASACNYDNSASINDGSCDYSACFGCTDADACNYDNTATNDDGGCAYPASSVVDCDGNCINDGNNNGICDEQETLGCTDVNACNFVSEATFSDNSCEYSSCTGCTNASACNYDSDAQINDGSCEFTSCTGCTTSTACNYDVTATVDDGSCTYPEPEYDCAGDCVVDSDGDGICDAFDGNYDGCMDALACNYDPFADSDDGSCDFCSCSGFTTDIPGYGFSIEETATNEIPGYTTYRLYITTPNATDKVSAVTGVTGNPLIVETTGDFYQHPNGGVYPNGINPILYDFVPLIQYDSWFTVGIDAAPVSANGEGNIQGLPEPDPWTSIFEGGAGFTIDDVIGSGWFVNPDATNGIAGVEQKVLLAQLTTNGDLSGQFYVQVFPEGNNNNQERVTLTFGGSQCGCMDVTACNYAATAIIDDGSCYFPQFGYGCDDICLFDSEAPEFTETPEDMNVSCSADLTVVMPSATDNCDQDLTFTYSDEIVDGPCGQTYDIVRSYIATDDFGQADTVSHVIHVIDEQAPVFTNVPADGTVECGDAYPTAEAVAVDNCNGVTITHTDEVVSTACGNTLTMVRTWSATDACGNVSTATTTYTVVDSTDPVISDLPADTTVSCEAEYSFPMPSSSDACGEVTLSEEVTTQEGSCANSYTLIRSFTAIDACGNFSQAVQAVTVVDNTAPVLSGVPADATLECGVALPAHTVTAQDGCEGAVDVLYTDVETILDNCRSQLVRTFTATDACGNAATADWTLIFEDTTAPTFTVPADVTLDCGSATTPAETGNVTDAADVCDVSPSVTYSDAVSSSTFSLEGLTADIRVELRLNNLPAFPRVLQASGVTLGDGVELDVDDEQSNPVNLRGAISVDVVGSSIDLAVLDVIGSESYDFIEVRLSNVSGGELVNAVLGANNLFADLNAAIYAQSVTANEIVMSWTEVAGGTMAIVDGGSASATALNSDNCLSDNTITRTWTVTDACGNASSETQVITLEDNTAPVFDFVPSDQLLDCAGEYALEMATATDICSSVEVTYTDSETMPCPGSRVIERTFTALDLCGNTSTHVQTISFIDNTAPVFTSTPVDLALECGDEIALTLPEAQDNCGEVSITYSDETVEGNCSGNYTILRTFVAEDDCGNSVSFVQNIVFTDTTVPVVLSVPTDTTYIVVAGEALPSALPVAEDLCGAVSISFVDICSEQGFGGYTATRTFTIVDDCGNTVVETQELNVLFTLGCDDPDASNYNAAALAGNGTCLYEGCTNPEAFNYSALADIDDGSCIVAAVEGCTDATACNYFLLANVDDGSCDYCSCLNAPVIDGYSLEMETVAVNGVPGMTTYRMYVTMVNPTDVMSSVVGETGLETHINTSTSFYQDPFGGALGQAVNPVLYGISPQLEYDSYVTIGLTQAPDVSAGEVEVTAVESDGSNWVSPFEAGGNLSIDGEFGGVWFTLNGASNAAAGDDLRVLIGQFTTSGSISGQVSLQVFPEGDGDNALVMTFPIGNSACGCTDVEACNFDSENTNDDGSCAYAGIYQCDGETCSNDVDNDGICDELEVPGCTDITALNYEDAASDDDGSCLFLGCMDNAADNYDSSANVEGFCSYPVEGCTDSDAANYDEAALTDDGSCLYPGCTDESALNYDSEANFNSGCILPLEGCTDPQAENYNDLANTNDGSCEYTQACPGDLNGDGAININDLLDFFQIYGQTCPE